MRVQQRLSERAVQQERVLARFFRRHCKGPKGAAVEPRITPIKAPRRPQGGQRDTSGMGHAEYVEFSKQNQGSKPKVTIFSM